jgi:hypothetical protein
MQFNILFETSSTNDYVGVLQNSSLVQGKIVSQDAGSDDAGLYYQVAGEGVNGLFKKALAPKLCATVNADLKVAYDNRFGANAWTQDSGGRLDRLTSFYVPLPPNAHSIGLHVGNEVAGLVYSVGPRVGGPVITDHKQYAQIYLDAFAEVIAANGNGAIEAIRLCVLSTGIYGPPNPKDKQPMARDAAGVILDALVAGTKLPGAAQLPSTMLVNCSSTMGYERDAFTYAATARGITVTSAGFTL